jgi:hypothetical protein
MPAGNSDVRLQNLFFRKVAYMTYDVHTADRLYLMNYISHLIECEQ